jgi:hypothetical protein
VQRCPITTGLDSQKRTEDGLRLPRGTGWGISPMHIHRAPSFQVLRCQFKSQPSHNNLYNKINMIQKVTRNIIAYSGICTEGILHTGRYLSLP